jgi:hypothetical protein
MTESMRVLQEAGKPPTEFDLMGTVFDNTQRYSSRVRVPVNASWDQVMSMWRVQAYTDNPDLTGYPGVAAPYVFKNDAGDSVVSMDGISRVNAHYLPAMVQAPISQPASDGTVMIRLIHHALDS